MQKWVRLGEVRDYLAFGWHVAIFAGAPPPEHRIGWCLVERR